MRRFVVIAGALALLAAAAPVPAVPARQSLPACALGGGDSTLHDFYAKQLERAERRFGGTRQARRIFSAGVAAYVYGFGSGGPPPDRAALPREPAREHRGARRPRPVRTVVFPNVDTTYTIGRLNLSAGPRVIDVPDTAGRYYVIQLLDAYSNTFAYVGRRTTGTQPGSYAIVPRGHSGPLPAGVRGIESPTNLIWVIGRTLVRDAADLPAATQLMGGYRVTDLLLLGRRRPPAAARAAGLPVEPAAPGPARPQLLRRPRRRARGEPAAGGRPLRPEGLRRRRYRGGTAPSLEATGAARAALEAACSGSARHR